VSFVGKSNSSQYWLQAPMLSGGPLPLGFGGWLWITITIACWCEAGPGRLSTPFPAAE
jgi:hypothetical protein